MSDYGKRTDGTKKGPGYFGELKRPDGSVSTEISVGVGFDDGEHEIPTLVPTLPHGDQPPAEWRQANGCHRR